MNIINIDVSQEEYRLIEQYRNDKISYVLDDGDPYQDIKFVIKDDVIEVNKCYQNSNKLFVINKQDINPLMNLFNKFNERK